MFVLQATGAPTEFDGHVNFKWLSQHSEFRLLVASPGSFLEIRLGYPETDPAKLFTVRSPLIAGGRCAFTIRRGWNSYFAPLATAGSANCEIIINQPLIVAGDTRFLGAMLSYAAVTDDASRVREIEEADQQIQAAVAHRAECSSLSQWVNWLYETVLTDEDEFYGLRALEAPSADSLRDPVERFSVRHKRERWIIDRLQEGVVVEIGCGQGGLVQAKDKGCRLIGVDLSLKNCSLAHRRGYDTCLKASAVRLPLADASVDHVVSADVLGHVPAEYKEPLVAETWRVLKPGGTCLHLIETDEFDPEKMSAEEFARMVLIDGHVGIASRQATEQLFGRHFEIVECFLVGNTCMSLWHLVRAHYFYGANLPGEVLSRLLNATTQERDFFDLGVGLTFWRLLAEHYQSASTGGLLFLHGRKSSG